MTDIEILVDLGYDQGLAEIIVSKKYYGFDNAFNAVKYFRAGHESGYSEGLSEGYWDGYSDGHNTGFGEGLASE